MLNEKNHRILFIGGAPKSGTSSLFDLVAAHPQVTPSVPKETFYLVDPRNPKYDPQANIRTTGWNGFFQYFPQEKDESNILLEGTTQLLFQTEIFEFVKELNDAKIIFILREPARRILSAYEFVRYNFGNFKKELSFLEYTELLLHDRTDALREYVRPPSDFFLGCELDISTYHHHLERWTEALGPGRVKVFQFEQFKRDPAQILDQIGAWLDLDGFSHSESRKEARNTTFYPKNLLLHYWIKKAAAMVPKGKIKKAVKHFYVSRQSKTVERPTTVDTGLQQLKAYFRPHNEKLARWGELDLKLWE